MKNKMRYFFVSIITAIAVSLTGFTVYANTEYQTGDLDGDGNITSSDALLILQKVTGIIDEFPIDSGHNYSIPKIETEKFQKSYAVGSNPNGVIINAEYPIICSNNAVAAKAMNRCLDSIRISEDDIQDMVDKTKEIYDVGFSNTESSTCNITYEITNLSSTEIMSLVVTIDKHIIGSNGYNISVFTFNFDIETGSLLTLKDLTGAYNYKNILGQMSENMFSEISKYGAIESKYELYDLLKENWVITIHGIEWYFAPYMVAAGAYGTINVNSDTYFDYANYYSNYGIG